MEGPCIFPAMTFRFLFGKAGHDGDGASSQVGVEVSGKVTVALCQPFPGGVKRHSHFLLGAPEPFIKTQLVTD